jgi:hypothetical protein
MSSARLVRHVRDWCRRASTALRASRWERGVALVALVLSTANCVDNAPPRGAGEPGWPTQTPAWGVGITEPRMLLEFRRHEAEHAPDWCRHPDTLLEELERVIAEGRGLGQAGCSARLEDSVADGRILEIRCPMSDVTRTCVDTYRALVWGNRHDNAPANYTLYGIGWVRRACRSAAGDFTPAPEAEQAAMASSLVLSMFLDQCRRRSHRISRARNAVEDSVTARHVLDGAGAVPGAASLKGSQWPSHELEK